MRVVRKNTLIWGLRFEYGAILKGSQTTPLRVSVRT